MVARGTTAGDPYSVTVVAEYSISSANQTFNWTVNCDVASTTPADQTDNQREAISLMVNRCDQRHDKLVTPPPRVGMAN
jgi:hypothetical protein